MAFVESVASVLDMGDRLVEREVQMSSLDTLVAEPLDSGRVMLLSGEAGNGKTSLIREFTRRLDHRYTILMTHCEPVGAPAAFAPLFDLADDLPRSLFDDIRSGAGRPVIYSGMLDLLKNGHVVLILEDIHWADEATLGLVRYLGKRIESTDSLLFVSYRSEEIDLQPQLRLVVADLGPAALRIELPPLTVDGVRDLLGDVGLDPEEVHSLTGGNPFYIQELARNPTVELPPNAQNAILASATRLDEKSLEFLRLVALSPDGVAAEDVPHLIDGVDSALDRSFQLRLLASEKGRISCRHELIRQSIVQAIGPGTAQRLHARLLENLESRPALSPDTARLSHHSIGARDGHRAGKYSLQAAREAARARAHRQAAYHFANAVLHPEGFDADLSDVLLEGAREHSVINAFETAVDLARRRLDLASSDDETARCHSWIAFFESRLNDLVAARASAAKALEVLSDGPPSEELALALSVVAWVDIVEGHWDRAAKTGKQAAEIARAIGSVDVEVHALTTEGSARVLLGDLRGVGVVEQAVALGLEHDGGENTAKALNNLGLLALERGHVEEAGRIFMDLQEYCATQELDAWYIAAVVTMAWIDVVAGRFDDADRNLEIVAGQRTCFQTEIEALVVSARLRMRRGDPGGLEQAEKVFSRLEGFNDHDAQLSGCELAMEGAWLGAVPTEVAADSYERLLDSPALAQDGTGRGRLAFWAKRLGFPIPFNDLRGPVAMEVSGDVSGAADIWDRLGFFVESHIVGATAPNADLDGIFAALRRVGANGVAKALTRELHRRGVSRIPRGESPTTRRHPAGLTKREDEVLQLLSAGLTNSVIAERLYISEKTAGHHVSSVLAKLGVARRGQAAALAVANGWADASQI